MARRARKVEIEEMVSRLGREATDRLQAKTARLIGALQARALLDAREITAELMTDLNSLEASETRSRLSEVSDLLQSDAVFGNCDRLSYLLLDLEQRISVPSLPPDGYPVLPRPIARLRKAIHHDLQSRRIQRAECEQG